MKEFERRWNELHESSENITTKILHRQNFERDNGVGCSCPNHQFGNVLRNCANYGWGHGKLKNSRVPLSSKSNMWKRVRDKLFTSIGYFLVWHCKLQRADRHQPVEDSLPDLFGKGSSHHRLNHLYFRMNCLRAPKIWIPNYRTQPNLRKDQREHDDFPLPLNHIFWNKGALSSQTISLSVN